MLVVIRLQIGLRDRNRLGQLGSINKDVPRFALLGNGVHILLLVLVVKRLQFDVGDLDLLLHIVEGQDSVVELDLGVLLPNLFFDFLVADGGSGAHCRKQFLLGDLVLQFLFELSHAEPELVLHKILILLLSDEVAAREEQLTKLALVQVVDQFLIAYAQPMRSAS